MYVCGCTYLCNAEQQQQQQSISKNAWLASSWLNIYMCMLVKSTILLPRKTLQERERKTTLFLCGFNVFSLAFNCVYKGPFFTCTSVEFECMCVNEFVFVQKSIVNKEKD